MPENVSHKKKSLKRGQTNARKSVKSPRESRRPRAQIGTVEGVYPSAIKAEAALQELKQLGFRNSEISVSYVAVSRENLVGTAARITGSALALSSVALASPIIFVMQILGMEQPFPVRKTPVVVRVRVNDNQDAVKHAREALLRSGGRKVGLSVQHDQLKSREYRDELGKVRHHPRAFMQNHAGELRELAA